MALKNTGGNQSITNFDGMGMQLKVTRQALNNPFSNLITHLTAPAATCCQLTPVQLSRGVLQIVRILRAHIIDLPAGRQCRGLPVNAH